jgi:hypothetical protein
LIAGEIADGAFIRLDVSGDELVVDQQNPRGG